MEPLPNLTCPLCGSANGCLPAQTGSFSGECWCARVSVSEAALAKVPEQLRRKACLCPSCAAGVQPAGLR